MISSNIDPRLAAQQADTKDLIRFKQEMDGLKKRLSEGVDTKEQQLKKACQNFEAVFIGKLWQQMKQSVPKEGYLHSKQEDSYMGMFDKEFSEKMAQAGGIGLADVIFLSSVRSSRRPVRRHWPVVWISSHWCRNLSPWASTAVELHCSKSRRA